MLTDEDIKKLGETIATKEDLNVFATREELVGLFATKEDILSLDEKTDALKEIVQGLAVNVDKFVRITADLKQEYAVAVAQTDRHEKWIKQIADKIDVQLEY